MKTYKVLKFIDNVTYPVLVVIDTESGVEHQFYAPSVVGVANALNGITAESYVGKTISVCHTVPLVEIPCAVEVVG